MEGLFCVHELLQEGNGCFHVQCITHQGIRLCSVFMVNESLRVPLFLLWLGTSSKILQKIAKNIIAIMRRINILHDMLKTSQIILEEIIVSRETVVFLLQISIFLKFGEVHLEYSSKNTVPWGNNKFFEDMLVFTTGEGVKKFRVSVIMCLTNVRPQFTN